MRSIDRQFLATLAERSAEQMVSIYLPNHTYPQSRENKTRFKNLLTSAERQLQQRGLSAIAARELLATANGLLNGSDLWEEQGGGLAVLLDPEGVEVVRTPMEVQERCIVDSYFDLIPLVTWLNEDEPYFLLAISQNEVNLYRGVRADIEPVQVPAMPTNQRDALRFDDPQPARQQHAAQRGTPGKQGLVFHGQGGAPDASKDEIIAYFRIVDAALGDVLRARSEPLIFAGVDYLFPLFRDVNSYKHLLPDAIEGNPGLWSAEDLRTRAWPLIEARVRERRANVLSRYGDALSAHRATDHLDAVLLAAHAGAVDTLFLDPNTQIQGNIDFERQQVSLASSQGAGTTDLASYATALVLRNSGWVEVLDANAVPGGGPMAALLRYPVEAVRRDAVSVT